MNTKKLRDMNLGAVADELEELRAYKEAAEKQEPVAVMYKTGGALTKAECIDGETFSICCRVETPLYAKPVPADKPAVAVPDTLCKQLEIVSRRLDKDGLFVMRETVNSAIAMLSASSHSQQGAPAVAVPDGFREIVEAVAHIGVDFGYGNFALSQEHIEKARALIEAAPSHSQQSAECSMVRNEVIRFLLGEGQLDGLWFGEKFNGMVKLNPFWWRKHLPKLNADSCPSHESEQGGSDV